MDIGIKVQGKIANNANAIITLTIYSGHTTVSEDIVGNDGKVSENLISNLLDVLGILKRQNELIDDYNRYKNSGYSKDVEP